MTTSTYSDSLNEANLFGFSSNPNYDKYSYALHSLPAKRKQLIIFRICAAPLLQINGLIVAPRDCVTQHYRPTCNFVCLCPSSAATKTPNDESGEDRESFRQTPPLSVDKRPFNTFKVWKLLCGQKKKKPLELL